MPRGRQLRDDHTLSGAERQACYRAQFQAQRVLLRFVTGDPLTRRTRPQPWHDGIAELIALQADYAVWADALPDALGSTVTADALQAIAELDLDDLTTIEPPRGYGRD